MKQLTRIRRSAPDARRSQRRRPVDALVAEELAVIVDRRQAADPLR